MKNNNCKTITVKMNKKGARSNVDKIYLFLGDIGDKFNLHIRNVEFGDGYFIFNIGKNKVCHFEIKECKKCSECKDCKCNNSENKKNEEDIDIISVDLDKLLRALFRGK